MDLITLESYRPVISPMALTIKDFKFLWDRDKSPKKETAVQELAFVFYMADYKSIFNNYSDDVKQEKIISSVGMDAKWKPDAAVLKAVATYEELQLTPSMSLLKDAQSAVGKIRKYFTSATVDEDTSAAQMQTFIRAITSVGNIIDSLAALELRVEKEIGAMGRVRGGGTLGNRELPKRIING